MYNTSIVFGPGFCCWIALTFWSLLGPPLGLSPFCGDEHNQPRYPLDNEIHAQTDEMLLISLQNLNNGIRNVARVVRQAVNNLNAERIITQGAIETKPQSQQTEGDK